MKMDGKTLKGVGGVVALVGGVAHMAPDQPLVMAVLGLMDGGVQLIFGLGGVLLGAGLLYVAFKK